MKKLMISIGVLVVFGFVLSSFLPTSVGHAVYASATDMEAELYGLVQSEADIGDMKIAYYSNVTDLADARPVVLLLHGYSADKDVWPRFAKNFVDEYRVLIPDMAGHGDTGFDKSWNYSAPAQSERMARFLDAMNIEKAHVMGNSMGGFISAHFAKMYPERTLSATLVDPAGVKAPTPSDMENMLASGENPFLIDSREGFDAFFAMTMAEPPWFPDFILDAVAEKYQNRKSELLHIFKGFHGKDMLDAQLTSITPPVLLLWGGKDQLLHVSSVEVWKQIPNIQVHVWPEIGHMPMMEVPGDSAKVVKDFINSLSQS